MAQHMTGATVMLQIIARRFMPGTTVACGIRRMRMLHRYCMMIMHIMT